MPPSVGLCYFEAHELETDRKPRRPALPRSAAGDDPRILCATRGTGSLDAAVVAARHRRSSHRKLRHGRRPLAADLAPVRDDTPPFGRQRAALAARACVSFRFALPPSQSPLPYSCLVSSWFLSISLLLSFRIGFFF